VHYLHRPAIATLTARADAPSGEMWRRRHLHTPRRERSHTQTTLTPPTSPCACTLVVVGVLGQGDYFGEMALLTNQPRSADVKASSDCMLLSLGKNDLRVVLQAFPTAKVRILSASSATHSARAYSLLHCVISAH
jgi:hypothetical protein